MKDVTQMEKLCGELEVGKLSQTVLEEIPEIAMKLAENEKLRYRIGIMKKAIERKTTMK